MRCPSSTARRSEVRRQPLEEEKVTISQAMNSSTVPADFILVAAMNPWPCGYHPDPRRAWSFTPPPVEKSLGRISGPLSDRIDVRVEVPAVPFTQLAEMPPGPTFSEFRAQVLEARAGQSQRFNRKSPLVNGRMNSRQFRELCQLRPLPDGPPGPTPRAGSSPCEMGYQGRMGRSDRGAGGPR